MNTSTIYQWLLQSMHNFHYVNCVSKCFQMMKRRVSGSTFQRSTWTRHIWSIRFSRPMRRSMVGAQSACGCPVQPTIRTAGRSFCCCFCWCVSSGWRWIPCPPSCRPSEWTGPSGRVCWCCRRHCWMTVFDSSAALWSRPLPVCWPGLCVQHSVELTHSKSTLSCQFVYPIDNCLSS